MVRKVYISGRMLPEAEAKILRDLATAYPNITAIRVRDAIDRVTEALNAIAEATAWAAAATLLLLLAWWGWQRGGLALMQLGMSIC